MTGERIAVILVFGALLLSGIGLVAMMMRARQRLQELAIRERIALIERGLVPSPETNPAGFEKLMSPGRRGNRSATRYQSAGVLIMGLGLALAVLLGFAADQFSVGLGVGGAVAIVGLAAFINGSLGSGESAAGTRTSDS